jgi:predicted enzyme related to lactoylglutathione lyase
LSRSSRIFTQFATALNAATSTPAHWLAYFTVSDCDATATAAKNLGANLYMPPSDFEDVGRISVIADPQGAAFAIFKAAARGASGS